VEIVDAKGSRLPQQLLHHVNVITPGRRELFSRIMQRVAGGMGALGGIILPSRRAAWPSPNQTDPEYERDVHVAWRLDGRHATGHHH
jgi:hypothetical protein